jgi:hypothetical protein
MDVKLAGAKDDDEKETEDSDQASENGSTESETDDRKVAAVASANRKRSHSVASDDADPGSHQEEDSEKRMRTSADSSVSINLDKASHEQRWGEKYKRLVEYKNKNGESGRYKLGVFASLSFRKVSVRLTAYLFVRPLSCAEPLCRRFSGKIGQVTREPSCLRKRCH